MASAWGSSWGSAWGDSWGVISTADTHDGRGGSKKPWHQRIEKVKIDERAKSYRYDRKKLHEDILFAMDGPIEGEVLDVIRSELEPEDYAKFGTPDYEPELKSLLSQTEALRKIARLVLEQHEREDEDDVEFLLLQ